MDATIGLAAAGAPSLATDVKKAARVSVDVGSGVNECA
jgi:hypothetical protein